MNDKRLLISITISVVILIVLAFMNTRIYNNAADTIIPFNVISISIILLCRAEKKVRVLLLICLSFI